MIYYLFYILYLINYSIQLFVAFVLIVFVAFILNNITKYKKEKNIYGPFIFTLTVVPLNMYLLHILTQLIYARFGDYPMNYDTIN
jgi:hypothetical protein